MSKGLTVACKLNEAVIVEYGESKMYVYVRRVKGNNCVHINFDAPPEFVIKREKLEDKELTSGRKRLVDVSSLTARAYTQE